MSDAEILQILNENISAGNSVILCTLIKKEGSGPRNPGAKMLIISESQTFGTIGGGGMERILVGQGLDALKEGKPRVLQFTLGTPEREGAISVDSKCGGEIMIFIDVIKPDPRLVVMGSGLIAQAVARYASDCGFEVVVVDDASTACADNFPRAKIVNDPYPASLEKVQIRKSDFVSVLHGETAFELPALLHAVKAKPAYIGLLGSVNKANKHKEQLIRDGCDPLAVDTIHGPIGLDISAETPEEIAISIVAEMIRAKNS